MNRLHKWALGAAFAALLGAVGWAQSLSPLTLTGNESWVASVGGPQGNSIFVTTSEIRNTAGYVLTTIATGALTADTNGARIVFTSALTGAVTHTTPPLPFDGEILEIVNGTASNFTQTITLTANTGQTVTSGAVVNLASRTSAEWLYSIPSLTWFRVR